MFQLKQGIRKSLSVAAVFLVLAWTQANGWADEILVAAASDLSFAIKEIVAADFEKQSPHRVKLHAGVVGKFSFPN